MSEIDDALALNDAVQKLRISYEQYFAGVERFEPLKERDKVKRELRRLMGMRSNNTAFRFRMQTIQATLVTHETHWDRIVRQIEEGTFKRDRLKVQRREQALRDATADVDLLEDDVHDLSDDFEEIAEIDQHEASVAALLSGTSEKPAAPRASSNPLFTATDDLDLDLLAKPFGLPPAAATPGTSRATTTTAPRPAAPAPASPMARPLSSPSAAPRTAVTPASAATTAPRSAAPRPAPIAPRPAQTASPGGDDTMQKLHAAFVSARAQTGESKPISVETLAETVRKQTAAVKAQLGCNDVEFKVAIKDGKAVLKATPK